MPLVQVLIWLIAIIAIGAIVWWFTTAVPLPEPFRIVLLAVVAIIAIIIILSLLTGTPPLPTLRR